jgi:serine/threonine protein kinase
MDGQDSSRPTVQQSTCPVCGAPARTITPRESKPESTDQYATQLDSVEKADSSQDWPLIPGYEILAELGRGGMGVVYKARQVALHRLVALKMIRSRNLATDEDLARFRSEAMAVARLQHPNVVQIYEIGDHNGLPYFSLEYVGGGSLQTRLAGAPQQPRQVAETVETLARAMQVAHQCGIIHRDLKPANVLVTRAGVPKISDFGLAKQIDTDSGQTTSGTIIGTPSYMAPEQAEGRLAEVGPVTDVYALGAVLFELLTGRPPFRGPSVLDTLDLVRDQEPVRRVSSSPRCRATWKRSV